MPATLLLTCPNEMRNNALKLHFNERARSRKRTRRRAVGRGSIERESGHGERAADLTAS